MNKKGTSAISTTLITMFSLVLLVTLAINLINMMLPFITYGKIQSIANKYMFVIEKYGFLMEAEKESLIQEIEEQGIKREDIILSYPDKKELYGQLLELKITCNYRRTAYLSPIILSVKKYSYAKM